MNFEVFSLFPHVFTPYLQESILKRAIENQIIEVNLHNIRDWAEDKHHTTDDTPFGGGGGMVMKPEPIFKAIESILGLFGVVLPIKSRNIKSISAGRRLSIEKAKRELGFQPKVNLEEGIRRAIEWYKKENLL